MLGHFRSPAAPGKVRGVPTSLSVSLPTRQLTLGGVISAVAHMDFCFERCPISFRPASILWCSAGTALSRSPHWTGLTLRPCRERYKTRNPTESTSSKGGHTPDQLMPPLPSTTRSFPLQSHRFVFPPPSHLSYVSSLAALLIMARGTMCGLRNQKSVKTGRKDAP